MEAVNEFIKFQKEHADYIVRWNEGTDADFLVQWSGKGFTYPITKEQICVDTESRLPGQWS